MGAAVVILVLPCAGWVEMAHPPDLDNRLVAFHISSLEVMQVSISMVLISFPQRVPQLVSEQVILGL